jgi:regulatory protein
MVELGYVDDAAFARAYAHDQMVVRRRGAVLVKRQLAAKGIDAETISQVLKTLANDDTIPDEAERAKKAIGRRGIGWDLLPPPMRKRKMTEFLLRRGFSSSCIRTLVDDSSGSDYNTEDRNGEDG